jgi:hypothetical protein
LTSHVSRELRVERLLDFVRSPFFADMMAEDERPVGKRSIKRKPPSPARAPSAPPERPAEAVLFYAEVMRWVTFPVPPGTKKSYVSGRFSKNGRRWGADKDPRILDRYWRRFRGANVGLPCGAENGIWVLEADTPEGHEVDGIANLAALVHHHNKPLPDTLTAISPTGSVHRYFEYPKHLSIRNSASKIAPGVDVRGRGGMVLAPPSHKGPRDARQYRWLNWDTPIAPAPSWLLKLVARQRRRKRALAVCRHADADIAMIEAALDVIAKHCARTGEWSYDLWYQTCCALQYELGEDGFALFDAWSSKSPTYTEADCLKKWEYCHAITAGAFKVGTIFHFANAADPHWHDNYLIEAARGRRFQFKAWRMSKKPKTIPVAISLEDFVAHLPGATVTYVYLPTMEQWSAKAVKTQLPPIVKLNANGQPVLDEKGEPVMIAASTWLDINRPVQQMTWAPGEPRLIENKLIADGGWMPKPEAMCLNLYRPPIVKLGDARKAGPWIELVKKVYPADHEHLFCYFAQRRQHPEIKINHALMLGGSPGIGKDTILAALRHAVGPWNFAEIAPHNLFEPFNPHIKSVVVCISEARDLGDVNRFTLYERAKTLMASPPDVLRCNEKHLRQHYIVNVTGVIITTNHKTDGIFLPADDRRHYVAWSPINKEDFAPNSWVKFWHWYEHGGVEHVAAFLQEYDLSDFDCKAPPLKTEAFWEIVTANRASEEGELADVIDKLGKPEVTTFKEVYRAAAFSEIKTAQAAGTSNSFSVWLEDKKNRKAFTYRMEDCGYAPVRSPDSQQGLWQVVGERMVVYGKAELSLAARLKAVGAWIRVQEAKAKTQAKVAAARKAKDPKAKKSSIHKPLYQ